MKKALLLMIGIAIGYVLKVGLDSGAAAESAEPLEMPPGDPWAADDHLLEGEFDPEALVS